MNKFYYEKDIYRFDLGSCHLINMCIIILLVQGCELTAYRPLGFHGGYSNSNLGNATYRIYFQGTYFSDYETIREFFHRRASELCQGHGTNLYEVLELKEHPCKFCLMVKPEIIGTIQCLASTKNGKFLKAASQLDRDFSLLANQLIQTVSKQSFRIAVLPFQNTRDNKPGPIGFYLSDKLAAALFKLNTVQVVERNQLDKAVQELKISHSGLFDEAVTKSIGRFLGADTIIIGSYTLPERREAEINARIVELETGRILGVGSIQIPRIWLEGLM